MSASPPGIVAIDSMTLVWGIRGQGTGPQQQRARWLFEQLEEEEAQVIVPAVALSEYLTPVDPDGHAEIIATLSARFQIRPFDAKCAAIAARLFSEGKEARVMDRKNARKILRADCLIIATAYCHGARVFYSGDKRCRNLANKMQNWQVCDLPDVAPNLFRQ